MGRAIAPAGVLKLYVCIQFQPSVQFLRGGFIYREIRSSIVVKGKLNLMFQPFREFWIQIPKSLEAYFNDDNVAIFADDFGLTAEEGGKLRFCLGLYDPASVLHHPIPRFLRQIRKPGWQGNAPADATLHRKVATEDPDRLCSGSYHLPHRKEATSLLVLKTFCA